MGKSSINGWFFSTPWLMTPRIKSIHHRYEPLWTIINHDQSTKNIPIYIPLFIHITSYCRIIPIDSLLPQDKIFTVKPILCRVAKCRAWKPLLIRCFLNSRCNLKTFHGCNELTRNGGVAIKNYVVFNKNLGNLWEVNHQK